MGAKEREKHRQKRRGASKLLDSGAILKTFKRGHVNSSTFIPGTEDHSILVLDYAAWLEKFCDHINRCDVAVEQTNHTHQKGNPYRCRIDVTVSRGHELVADERQMDNGSHQPLNKVIHDAFKTMERELRRVVDKQRRDVKTHADSRSPK